MVVPAAVLLLTVAQLAVATFVDGLPQFEAAGAGLAAYPVRMLVVPALWWLVHWREHGPVGAGVPRRPACCAGGVRPRDGTVFIDVTGNTLDLYDTVVWWDDANHFVNWALLCGGWACSSLAASVCRGPACCS